MNVKKHIESLISNVLNRPEQMNSRVYCSLFGFRASEIKNVSCNDADN
ncbi:hypothetical protein ANAPC5_01514 [Anaplasma phagocytophilum]|nr:hypothetical protein ANAPC5_01514 [Anaplasma phagocytophilum]